MGNLKDKKNARIAAKKLALELIKQGAAAPVEIKNLEPKIVLPEIDLETEVKPKKTKKG